MCTSIRLQYSIFRAFPERRKHDQRQRACKNEPYQTPRPRHPAGCMKYSMPVNGESFQSSSNRNGSHSLATDQPYDARDNRPYVAPQFQSRSPMIMTSAACVNNIPKGSIPLYLGSPARSSPLPVCATNWRSGLWPEAPPSARQSICISRPLKPENPPSGRRLLLARSPSQYGSSRSAGHLPSSLGTQASTGLPLSSSASRRSLPGFTHQALHSRTIVASKAAIRDCRDFRHDLSLATALKSYSSRKTCNGFCPRIRALATHPVAVASTALETSATSPANQSK